MMKATIEEKRQVLRTLTNTAKKLAAFLKMEAPVNELILKLIYNPTGKLSFNTFQGWKRDGYTVKKGVTAFLIWGQPRTFTRTDDAGEHEDQFFPIAHLFSSEQVFKPQNADLSKVAQEPDPTQRAATTQTAVPTL